MKKFTKIYIEITNSCNLSCSFCSESKRTKKTMTTKEFAHIINEIEPFTKSIYLHVKGEPFLNKNLDEFLTITDNTKLRVNITTNGTYLKDNVDLINRHSSIKKLNISIHADYNSEKIYQEIFNSVSEISTKITKIYRLWTLNENKLDAKSTKIVEKIIKYYNLSPEMVEKVKNDSNIKIAESIYVDKDNEFVWPRINNYQSTGFCHALKTHIAILVDGTVVPCCLDSEGIIALGNIFAESLIDIINSPRYQTLKKSFQDRKPSEKLCRSCTYKEKLN